MSAELPLVTSSEDTGDYFRCDLHAKRLEYLCDTHGYHVCADCAVFDHRDCIIVSTKTTSKHKKLSCNISPVLILAAHRIGDVNPKLGRLLQSRDAVSLTLDNYYQKLRDAIDAAESEQYSQLDFLFNIEETRLLAWKDECQQLMDKAKTRLESVRKGETTSIDKITKEIGLIKTHLEDNLRGNDTNVSFTFVGDTDFDKDVETFSLLPGKIVVKHEPLVTRAQPESNDEKEWTGINPQSPAILSESDSENFVDIPLDGATSNSINKGDAVNIKLQEETQDDVAERRSSSYDETAQENKILECVDPSSLSLSTRGRSMSVMNAGYSLTLKSSINARMPSDNSPSWLTGATFLVNNSIALADRKNKKIKLFSSALHCISEVVIPSYPFDIAQTGDFNLVVTVPRNKRALFFHSEDLKTCPMFIDTEQTCLGVSCSKEVIAIVCETSWTKSITIKLYDNSGSLTRKVSKIDDNRELAFTSDYISICPVSGNIAFRNGVNLFYTTSEGDLLWKSIIPNQLLSNSIRGISILNGGVLVVFDVSVFYVTSDGRQWKTVMSFSKQSSPSAVCVSRSKSSVLITHADPFRNRSENNVVDVFTLSQRFE
ncbi:uncharacterized protein LOC110448392 [Mizuhopecten yessoensis]|uniref:B box-type domain-containing protein n=1 Tax=Mizuhopecten yessoensis TaxID=6573 RepID=A0A210QT75_MIZYE|nr:uncharacterized protein LOC110448392 [Mizuhopecten yessoensis]OWF51912.1 hypothetical protein KP79_PYT18512 [Mizuhopecten yessoensis]